MLHCVAIRKRFTKREEGKDENKENLVEEESPLDENILQALGEDPIEEESAEIKLHSSIAKRWKHWFNNGLKETEKERLTKKYLRLKGLIVPKLNPEIAIMLTESSITRDKHFAERQQLATSALAALGSVIRDIAEEKDGINIVSFVEKINDAVKLINHITFEETQSHKAFILPMVEKQCKTLLKESETDSFLFGTNLGARIKEAQNLNKMGQNLKIQSSHSPMRRIPLQTGNLNYQNLQSWRPAYATAGNGNQ
ncbi:uncharacterized protein LOC128886425 [Hylaeus anthracinus]|uniref:uncharacterized protein LOC128886425 n=1 Tax=Hylaeus anthracinus TaxID=313031 RepID=UPI0023B8CD04|nr:uncharacterized protein LOC128886425 [Hylaeus anthracinus]